MDLAAYAECFQALLFRRGPDVLRADRIFVETGGRSLLVEALVVAAGRKLPFYVKISKHDRGSVTLRIDPMTHTERTQGVRDLVAELGADLLRRNPGSRVRVTNLSLPLRPVEHAETEDS